MNIDRKDGQLVYKGINVAYSAYGENKKYSARAIITIHNGGNTTEHVRELTRNCEKLQEAENEIIGSSKKWIDDNIH